MGAHRPTGALGSAGQFETVGASPFPAGGVFFGPGIQCGADAEKCAFAHLLSEGAAPDDDEVPAVFAPSRFVSLVATDVLRPFLHPEGDVAFRHRRIGASMPMPEAAAHIDKGVRPRHHDVGPPKKALVADAEPPAGGEEALAHENFRLRVFASDPAHDPAALLWGDAIHFGGELYHRPCLEGSGPFHSGTAGDVNVLRRRCGRRW